MTRFRILRLKDNASQQFRWSPHVAGVARVKHRDYEADGEIEAATEYAAWAALRDTPRALRVGDVLETEAGESRLCKYIGFDAVEWEASATEPAG
ncbi:MAG: hypothetical protein ACRD96_22250 [Bryobacteraceae bacterium]